jgi:hypothetical protein
MVPRSSLTTCPRNHKLIEPVLPMRRSIVWDEASETKAVCYQQGVMPSGNGIAAPNEILHSLDAAHCLLVHKVSSSSSRSAPSTRPVSSESRWPPGSSHLPKDLVVDHQHPATIIDLRHPQVTCPGRGRPRRQVSAVVVQRPRAAGQFCPVGDIVPSGELDRLRETIEVLSDTELVRDLREALADARAGRVFSADQIAADLAARRTAGE